MQEVLPYNVTILRYKRLCVEWMYYSALYAGDYKGDMQNFVLNGCTIIEIIKIKRSAN